MRASRRADELAALALLGCTTLAFVGVVLVIAAVLTEGLPTLVRLVLAVPGIAVALLGCWAAEEVVR